jgi:hypothetical protein
MKTVIPRTMLHLLITYFIAACCAASPELMNPEKAEVPFVEREFVGVSEHGAGYAFKVEKSKLNCTVILNKNSDVLDSIEFSKNIDIHSLNWTVGGAWFLVRVRTNNGSKVAALAYCDMERKDKQIILYKANVGKGNLGKIFDISEGENNQVKAVCSFWDPKTTKRTFYQGLLKKADLEVISREDFFKEYPDETNVEPNKPLRRVPE